MKKRVFFICAILFLACEASKKSMVITTKEKALKMGKYPKQVKDFQSSKEVISYSERKTTKKIDDVIATALSYNGTRYKYGGTTRGGMDCSGLVYTSFKENDIPLERSSYRMATQGKRSKLSNIQLGDLVFFMTNSNENRIDHVGLVIAVNDQSIEFIHATTSRGVLISSLDESYWKNTFVEVRTIL